MKHLCLVALMLVAAANAGCRQGPWSLWDAYTAHFLNNDGRIVEHSAADRTTSEGQSYGMFFALVDNDKARFDKVLNWTQNNLASGDMSKHLPGWEWGKAPDGQWKLLDPNPASDSDCWIAYDLLEAGRLWNNEAYTSIGRQMLAMIAKQEVADLPGFGAMLMPGPTTLWVHNNTWTLNPSYVPLFLFQRFSEVDPSGPWGAIAMNIPRLMRQSTRKGFAMDWVDYVPADGFYPAPPPGANSADQSRSKDQQAVEKQGPNSASKPPATAANNAQSDPAQANATAAAAKPPVGSYDAIRVYLWAGMVDESGHTRRDLIDSLSGMGAYLSNHDVPPEKVDAEGIPDGSSGPVGFSAAVLPYLWGHPELARAAAQQRVRIGAQLNPASGLYGKEPVYYDQNLVLFATGFLDKRFRFGPHGELKVEWTR